jgi:hypothetical protein
VPNRLICGVVVVAALALLVPTGALAFKPTGVTAAPANTQAGANSNFTLHFAVDEPRATSRASSSTCRPARSAP